MNWWDLQTGLYPYVASNEGSLRTFRDVLMCDFANAHYWRQYHNGKLLDGVFNDLETITDLRTKETSKEERLLLKGSLQCWQPSCRMTDKTKGKQPQALNPILCLDFDHLEEWDIESLKQSIFEIDYVCFTSLSCSGTGIYALILIEEPERLKDYAEHCFKVFQSYGIPIDTGKGQNPTQLRFVSYDCNMLFRDDPKPLKIPRINTPKAKVKPAHKPQYKNISGLVRWAVTQIQSAQVGQRFETVRRVSYAMGGHGYGLDEIKQAIRECSQFEGVQSKYLKHAEEGFTAGKLKPLLA